MTGSRRVAGGRRNGDIAVLPGIRAGTVKRHLENVYRKLGVSRRRDAAMLLAPLMPRGGRRDH